MATKKIPAEFWDAMVERKLMDATIRLSFVGYM